MYCRQTYMNTQMTIEPNKAAIIRVLNCLGYKATIFKVDASPMSQKASGSKDDNLIIDRSKHSRMATLAYYTNTLLG